jgi:hypothetical protein
MRLSLSAALAAFLAFGAAPAFAAPPPSLNFSVLRNGEPVGTHVVQFHGSDGDLQITVDTNVVVKIAMIAVYRFEHHDAEVWHGGHLISLASTTNDDGTRHKLSVTRTDAALVVNGDGNATRLPPETVPASLWNPATVGQTQLVNTLDGHAMAIQVADLGDDTVKVGGTPRPAHHYVMAGDLARELWYDASGTLIKVRFKAKDDSDIEYVLK